MRLTKGMLKAMGHALMELLAGEGPQGVHEDSDEAAEIMRNAERAEIWIAEQEAKRAAKSKAKT